MVVGNIKCFSTVRNPQPSLCGGTCETHSQHSFRRLSGYVVPAFHLGSNKNAQAQKMQPQPHAVSVKSQAKC